MSVINFTEFSTLTTCERKWAYAYLLQLEEEGAKKGLHLGTLCHVWHGNWLLGKGAYLPAEWTDDINTGGKPGEVKTLRLTDFDIELVARATWLAGRFVEFYGEAPPSSWKVLSAEEWLSREFPWGTLVGRSDGFVEIDGELYLIEVKSFGSRPGPLAYAQVSPQLGCYSLLAEQKYGKRPAGILMQGIYTYRWKPTVPNQATFIAEALVNSIRTPGGELVSSLTKKEQAVWAKAQQNNPYRWTERDPSESFSQVEVELGEDHLSVARRYLSAAVQRRDFLSDTSGLMLTPTPESRAEALLYTTLPNVGRDCSWCGFKARCWNDLGGVEEFEIELDEDDGEPV